MATTVRFKRLPGGEGLPLPERMTPSSVGFDLRAADTVEIRPAHLAGPVRVPTGFAICLADGVEAQVRARSGLALRGLIVANGPGTIDPDYRGPLDVILANLSPAAQRIERGERIAQLVLSTVLRDAVIVEADFDEGTSRGAGGFGSTGMR